MAPTPQSEGRQTRQQSKNSNSQSCDNIPTLTVKEIMENKDFEDFITRTVRSAVRQELKEIKEKLERLSEQVERNESKILTIEVENDARNVKMENLEKRLEKQSEQIVRLQSKANDSEQYSRRNCVRIFGVEENIGENTDDIVQHIATEKLGITLDKSDIDRSHRTGPPTKKTKQTNRQAARQSESTSSSLGPAPGSDRSGSNRCRPIIVKFATYRTRHLVMSARRLLKNTGITIAEDLTKSNYEILKKARASSKATSVWSQDGRIIAALPTANGTIKKVITSMEEALKL